MSLRIRTVWLPCVLLLLTAGSTWAQAVPPVALPTTLKQAFLAAWARQPEAQSSQARQDAASAHRQVADSWTPEPASLGLSIKSDRLHQNHGSREAEVELAVPLWLPGERARSGALADAEVRATASRVLAAQLRSAASVREAYWQWQRAGSEQELARERLNNAQQFAADVAKRVNAGDLARSDQHQADGAVASAELGLAEAISGLVSAAQQLRSLTGSAPGPSPAAVLDAGALSEPVPDPAADFAALTTRHPAVTELLDQAEVARRGADLARVQTRSNPELSLATARDRGGYGEPYQQSITLGLRIPFGSDSRNRARVATAQAELIEAQAQLDLERERAQSELETARAHLDSTQAQSVAADKAAQLARELRGFVRKSFQLGEADLPTRMRVELEAAEAERQASRTRIDRAQAVSSLRQALGLLPE